MDLRRVLGGWRRLGLVALTAAAALLVNLGGLLLAGVTVVLPHLLYLPIALAGYWFPRRGIAVSVGVAGLYAIPAILFTPSEAPAIGARAATLIAVGILIAYLSHRLRMQEAIYHGLYDHSVAGILIIEANGQVQDANLRAAALVGRAPDELEGVPFSELAAEPEVGARFLLAVGRGPVEQQELTLVREDGRAVHCLASGAPLDPGRRVVTLADMTGQHLAREALESANRTMATLGGILDHDLAAAVDELEACLARVRLAVAEPAVLALLRQLGDRVHALRRRGEVSREFRALGTRPPAWQRVGDAVEEARGRLDPGPVAVRAWTDRLEVYADPALPVALYHLLHNATLPETGATAVVVSYHHAPDGCLIVVEDDGVGVPSGERVHLFDPTSERYGHGLYLAREILGITGIGIAEEGMGRGARFVLSVPLEECRVS